MITKINQYSTLRHLECDDNPIAYLSYQPRLCYLYIDTNIICGASVFNIRYDVNGRKPKQEIKNSVKKIQNLHTIQTILIVRRIAYHWYRLSRRKYTAALHNEILYSPDGPGFYRIFAGWCKHLKLQGV